MLAMRFIKDRIKSALRRRGYELYRRPYLPKGVDPFESLTALWPEWRPQVIFDIGANTGQTVARLRPLFPGAAIHAFEPIPETYVELVKNIAALPDVRAYALALGECEGEMSVQLQRDSTLNSLTPALQASPQPNGTGSCVRVKIATLTGFCAAHEIARVDLLKIDTEGYELAVLHGAAPMLANGTVDFVLAEAGLMPGEPRFTPLPALIEHLRPHGFCLVGIYEQQGWRYQRGAEFCNALFALEKHLAS